MISSSVEEKSLVSPSSTKSCLPPSNTHPISSTPLPNKLHPQLPFNTTLMRGFQKICVHVTVQLFSNLPSVPQVVHTSDKLPVGLPIPLDHTYWQSTPVTPYLKAFYLSAVVIFFSYHSNCQFLGDNGKNEGSFIKKLEDIPGVTLII